MAMKKVFVCLLVVSLGLGGTLLWSQQQQVAVLATDAFAGETMLVVDWVRPGAVDTLLVIQSRDGTTSETHEVKHIYEDHIILWERLESDFPAGSTIHQ